MATQLATTEETNGQVPALTVEGERFALRQRQARMFAMSPLVPEHLRKGSTEQAIANCWIALTLAEAMGEVPLIVMQNIHVVNGKAGFASQYMIARANSSGIFKGRIDWRIDRSDPANLSVTAYAFLKETGQEVSVEVDMAMAQAEGWTKNPKYKTMPEIMLRYRSAAFLVRFYAPDVMLGYQTTEEAEDISAAALPSVPPLTAKMLTAQAEELLPHDAGTGELIEGAAEVEPEPEPEPDTDERQPEQQVNDNADEPATLLDTIDTTAAEATDKDPAAGKANEIIDEIKAQISTMDVDAVLAREGIHIDAMEEGLAAMVRQVGDVRKSEINAEREKAKLAGAAE